MRPTFKQPGSLQIIPAEPGAYFCVSKYYETTSEPITIHNVDKHHSKSPVIAWVVICVPNDIRVLPLLYDWNHGVRFVLSVRSGDVLDIVHPNGHQYESVIAWMDDKDADNDGLGDDALYLQLEKCGYNDIMGPPSVSVFPNRNRK